MNKMTKGEKVFEVFFNKIGSIVNKKIIYAVWSLISFRTMSHFIYADSKWRV